MKYPFCLKVSHLCYFVLFALLTFVSMKGERGGEREQRSPTHDIEWVRCEGVNGTVGDYFLRRGIYVERISKSGYE